MEDYHDREWGLPVLDERGLFERMSLEAFQSGLSWRTILAKRDAFRAAFAGFDPDRVARFGDADVARLLADAGIVRNRAKIEATLANAEAAVALRATGESLDALIRAHAPASARPAPAELGRRAGQDSRDGLAGARAQAPRLSLRRADDALCAHAGVWPGGRSPGRLPRATGRRAGAPRCRPSTSATSAASQHRRLVGGQPEALALGHAREPSVELIQRGQQLGSLLSRIGYLRREVQVGQRDASPDEKWS